MARFLGLEWDNTEARVAVAASRGDRVVIEQAFRVALPAPSAGAEAAKTPEGSVSDAIAAALSARRLARLDALVTVGRSSVELRQMSLPPAPDEELPDLVRFQALREFGALEEDWPLDFLPLDEDPAQPRSVLAVAVAGRMVDDIRQCCAAAGVKLVRLGLRPANAASLVLRHAAESAAEVRLLVDLLPGEAELTVLVGRKLVFLRCARLSGDPLADAAPALVSEIRLTMAAAQNQLAGKKVAELVLLGGGPRHADLARTLGDQLATPAVLFDPFEAVALEGQLQRALPEHRGRFAALFGMLSDELAGQAHAFDFLHPRRRPAPPSRRNAYLVVGAAVGAAVLLGLLAGGYQRSHLRTEVQRLQAESRALDKKVAQAARLRKAADEIDQWLAEELVWLDELRWLSERFPSAEEAMLTQLKMSTGAGRGEMVLDGLARNVDAVTKLDSGLHDARRRVAGKTKGEHESDTHYTVQFRSSLLVVPGKP